MIKKKNKITSFVLLSLFSIVFVSCNIEEDGSLISSENFASLESETTNTIPSSEQSSNSNDDSSQQNQDSSIHTHNISSTWSKNETHHWHTCSGCTEFFEKQTHSFTNITHSPTHKSKGYDEHECTVCGYYYVDNYTDELPYQSSQTMSFILRDDGQSYKVGGASSQSSVIEVPEEHEGLPVTEIGDYAFSGCNSIEAVRIPITITKIGPYSFQHINKFVPATVYYAGSPFEWAEVDGCNNLKILYYLDENGEIEYAGEKYSPLRNVVFPESVTSLPRFVYNSSPYLTEVTFLANELTMDSTAFIGCHSITAVTISGVVHTNATSTEWTFDPYEDISLYIDTTIDNWYNSNLPINVHSHQHIYIQNNNGDVTHNNKKYKKVTTLNIPNTISIIGSHNYNNWLDLTNVNLSSSVIEIKDDAFCGCTSLKTVTLTKNIEKIGKASFHGCYELTDIYFDGSTTDWDNIDKDIYWKDGSPSITVHCTNDNIIIP